MGGLLKGGLTSKEIALISVLSSLWIFAQLGLGHIVGRLSIGPFTMHGAVNRIVGWTLMLICSELTRRLGRTTLMSAIASLATRIIRTRILEALIVGVGYLIGGLVFDLLYTPNAGRIGRRYTVAIAAVSGASASIPYLILKLMLPGWTAFIALSPLYLFSVIKGTLLSSLGVLIALEALPRIKKATNYISTWIAP